MTSLMNIKFLSNDFLIENQHERRRIRCFPHQKLLYFVCVCVFVSVCVLYIELYQKKRFNSLMKFSKVIQTCNNFQCSSHVKDIFLLIATKAFNLMWKFFLKTNRRSPEFDKKNIIERNHK